MADILLFEPRLGGRGKSKAELRIAVADCSAPCRCTTSRLASHRTDPSAAELTLPELDPIPIGKSLECLPPHSRSTEGHHPGQRNNFPHSPVSQACQRLHAHGTE